MTNAPASSVSQNFMDIPLPPEEPWVDLARFDQVFQHLQTRERPMIENVFGHLYLLEHRSQLRRSGPHVPVGRVTQHGADFVEVHSVAAVVAVERAKAQLTS